MLNWDATSNGGYWHDVLTHEYQLYGNKIIILSRLKFKKLLKNSATFCMSAAPLIIARFQFVQKSPMHRRPQCPSIELYFQGLYDQAVTGQHANS